LILVTIVAVLLGLSALVKRQASQSLSSQHEQRPFPFRPRRCVCDGDRFARPKNLWERLPAARAAGYMTSPLRG
jgi:hypothetical protein